MLKLLKATTLQTIISLPPKHALQLHLTAQTDLCDLVFWGAPPIHQLRGQQFSSSDLE